MPHVSQAIFLQNILNAKIIQYRYYKHFHEKFFNFELNNELLEIDLNHTELKEFNKIFLKVLDKHAPRKHKYIRANNSDYIAKALRKEIMHRSRLRNESLREREREQKNLRLPITSNGIPA